MFQFPGFAFLSEYSMRSGLPHSEIAGSKLIRSSPTLIAAYHVLHRLLSPRHPPNALKTLDHSHYQCSSFSRQRRKKIIFVCTTAYRLLECIKHPTSAQTIAQTVHASSHGNQGTFYTQAIQRPSTQPDHRYIKTSFTRSF